MKELLIFLREFAICILGVTVVFGAIYLFVSMLTNIPRTDQATKYDMNCVTELNEKPLTECGEGSEK